LTAPEYIQLKAFARIDGALLSLLLMVSCALYIIGLTSPSYGLAAIILILSTPFFVGSRVRHFRDNGLEGTISFMRGWVYTIMMFFYGGLLLALALWAYLTYMDQGFLMKSIQEALTTPETAEAIKQLDMGAQIEESLALMGEMRPIDMALNMLTTTIMSGVVLGLPIAAVIKRSEKGVKGSEKGVNGSEAE
jgi:hypothetical protein